MANWERILETNPLSYVKWKIWDSYKRFALRGNMIFELEPTDLVAKFKCPYTDLDCEPSIGKGKVMTSPSYILKKWSAGFTKDNVVQCSLLYSRLFNRKAKVYNQTGTVPTWGHLLPYYQDQPQPIHPNDLGKIMNIF